MGLIVTGVPEAYVLALQKRFGINCFVETGTFEGRTAAWAAKHFERVVTIELSALFYHKASARLARHGNVQQFLGNSPQQLAALAPALPPSIIWLDAHWSGGGEEGRANQCPLLEELAALAPCWDRSFILVDDARLFLFPPSAGYDQAQWPSLTQVVGALGAGKGRFVACFDDVFVSLPGLGREPTVDYVRAAGVKPVTSCDMINTEGGPGPASLRPAGGPLRSALRLVRQSLRRPALALGRAVGHLPVQLAAQDRIVWFLRKWFEHPRLPFEIDFNGYRYPGSGDDLIDMAVYYYGGFEWPVLALLRDLARNMAAAGTKPVFYDVGANTGQHSLFVAREVRRIYAFEPYAAVREKFERRIALNALGHIDVLPLALGDQDGEAQYYRPLTINRGTGSFIAGKTSENSRRPTPLPMATGDRLIVERGLLPPDLIKIDVEGAEKLVLGGLAETIRRHRPAIVAELSDASRWLFGSEAELRAKLYPDCLLFDVSRRAVPRGYRLGPFDFARSEQFLCLPRERASLLRRARWPWQGKRIRDA